MSTSSVAGLLDKLQADPWRKAIGFSPDIEAANRELFDDKLSEQDKANSLAHWLANHQPCLFGRLAAKAGFLSYCILTEGDLRSSDEHVQKKIQTARSHWTREGFEGKKNGFIILAISPALATAQPDDVVKQLAVRLCQLYLMEDADNVAPDKVLHDRIYLEMPGRDKVTWTWQAGVNYFSSQGDKRWWHDHRIPGGMAISVNSVGHLVKSGILLRGLAALGEQLGVEAMSEELHKITSLEKALDLALRTIANAAVIQPSGKATYLLTLPEGSRESEPPINLTGHLAGKDWREYFGYYHTDYTIPSEYFRPDVSRPADLAGHVLDFTYLFESGAENPAFTTMGEGRRIRHEDEPHLQTPTSLHKVARFVPREVLRESEPRLLRALAF